MTHESLDQWIGRLNEGDVEAVERVFLAYEPYLRIAVRRRLSPRLRSKVDSGDIVQSVFADLVRGVRDGGWHFAGRPQLEAFLRRIAWRRLADRYQKHGRALEREHSLDETPSQSLGDAAQARPSQEAQGRELWESVLRACPPRPSRGRPPEDARPPHGRDRRADRHARGQRPPNPLRAGAPALDRSAAPRATDDPSLRYAGMPLTDEQEPGRETGSRARSRP